MVERCSSARSFFEAQALLAIALLLAAGAASGQRVGSSPFTPPPVNHITFVVDAAPGLDTGCTFRSGGPLRFSVKTTRFVGETNADGTLKDVAAFRWLLQGSSVQRHN